MKMQTALLQHNTLDMSNENGFSSTRNSTETSDLNFILQ